MIKGKFVLLFLLAILMPAGMPSCSRSSEEDRVKKVISEIEEAAENKKIGAILENISRSYRDPQGHDYNGIKALLLMYFYRHERISVYITGLELKLSDVSARAVFDAVLSGAKDIQMPADIIPEAMGIYGFEVLFAKEDGEWKVTSAKWERRSPS